MRNLALSIAIVLGMTLCAVAQTDGGFFGRGYTSAEANNTREGGLIDISLPTSHGSDGDSDAPVGSGIAVLMGLGAAYVLTKKKEK